MRIHHYAFIAIFINGLSLQVARAADNFTVGIEGFRDHYAEPGPDLQVDEHATYGSLTGNYMHSGAGWFTALDGRVSYGEDDYKSVSGTLSNTPQWELEGRLRGGPNASFAGGNIKPYLGLGIRYFYDEGSGTVTNLGYYGYDRHITQFYVPAGLTYKYITPGHWTFSPTVEYDQLVWGEVNSHLSSGGGPDLSNTQHSGYGLRADFMVGQQLSGYAWQVGPFIRYWNIRKSDIAVDPNTGFGGEEPNNTRLQAGGALRVTF